MAANKTRPTGADVRDFIARVGNETRRKDARAVTELMEAVSGAKPQMWGPSIVGFGTHRYSYADGRPGEICRIGFAPRAQSLVFYLGDFKGRAALLGKLGKHRTGRGCLYVNKLADVDLDVLETMLSRAWESRQSD